MIPLTIEEMLCVLCDLDPDLGEYHVVQAKWLANKLALLIGSRLQIEYIDAQREDGNETVVVFRPSSVGQPCPPQIACYHGYWNGTTHLSRVMEGIAKKAQ